jgi:putative transposase
MAEKFKNKYRIASHRKPRWDYSADALYFLTIVTQNRECNLGEIVETVDTHHVDTHGRAYQHGAYQQPTYKMELSDFGKIVEQEWLKSFEMRKELILYEYVIMPNHIHAIVEIYNENRGNEMDEQINDVNQSETAAIVDTHGRAYLPTNATKPDDDILSIKRNPPIRMPQSISSFMAGFKSAVNTKIDDYIDQHQLDIPKYNRQNHFFQPNYHDHIIRNQQEYIRISNYIIQNPQNWVKDNLYGNL